MSSNEFQVEFLAASEVSFTTKNVRRNVPKHPIRRKIELGKSDFGLDLPVTGPKRGQVSSQFTTSIALLT